jgi:hypothetical protein
MVETRVAKQQTFAGLAWQNNGKQTKRERFLAGMDAIIPWAQLLELIEPHYPKAGTAVRRSGSRRCFASTFSRSGSTFPIQAPKSALALPYIAP